MAKLVRKLAIVGASARAAAFSALRAGYEVAAADLFADADLQRACPAIRINHYPEGLVDWLAAAECDAWLYTGALENHPILIDKMAASRPLLGNVGRALRQVREPLVLQQTLKVAGLRFPETRASPEGLPEFSTWLCKTYRGAGGSGVWRLTDENALARAAREHAVFQRYIEGLSASAVFVCSKNGTTLLGVTRQLIGRDVESSKGWRYVGSVGTLDVEPATERQLHAIGDVLHRELQLRGLVGVDLVIAGDDAYVIEVNPRYSASVEIVERATGIGAMQAHVVACTSDRIDNLTMPATTARREFKHGKMILFAKRDAIISDEFHRWAMEQASASNDLALADIPAAGETIRFGHPVLTALVSVPLVEYDHVMSEFISSIEMKLYNN
jgi:predicted ATP-grasp superfamily ATP-dependent carboligase